eukprot:5546569-Pyramimonas_sp.AAC.1
MCRASAGEPAVAEPGEQRADSAPGGAVHLHGPPLAPIGQQRADSAPGRSGQDHQPHPPAPAQEPGWSPPRVYPLVPPPIGRLCGVRNTCPRHASTGDPPL